MRINLCQVAEIDWEPRFCNCEEIELGLERVGYDAGIKRAVRGGIVVKWLCGWGEDQCAVRCDGLKLGRRVGGCG